MHYEKQGFTVLKGAYGKFYTNRNEVLEAWNDGKDFKLRNFKNTYCSIRNTEELKKLFGAVYIEFGLDGKSVKVI